MKVTLNPEELKVLNTFNTSRSGGFQNFFGKLQARAAFGQGTLDLEPGDLERIARYAFDYGNGGWENRLKAVFGRVLGEDLGRYKLPVAPEQGELL